MPSNKQPKRINYAQNIIILNNFTTQEIITIGTKYELKEKRRSPRSKFNNFIKLK